MKKIILVLCLLTFILPIKAQQKVGEYTNSYFSKTFSIEAAEKNNKIENVYIGVQTDLDFRKAYISVEGEDLELFKNALELARDKFSEWKKIAKDNNITEMRKEMGIDFPEVAVAWLYGGEWEFSFDNKINLAFLILDDGQMVAAWAPIVTSSSNSYIDQQIYFAFADEKDFDNIINQLDGQRILNELLNTKNNSKLFN